jgi:putative component of membrane protein insertase Oxa1/YidC/SpoIIIJ protein YidD
LVLLALRAYQAWWTRRTPPCPRTAPDGLSCSEFGRRAVAALGVRAGLVAAAGRVQACGWEI